MQDTQGNPILNSISGTEYIIDALCPPLRPFHVAQNPDVRLVRFEDSVSRIETPKNVWSPAEAGYQPRMDAKSTRCLQGIAHLECLLKFGGKQHLSDAAKLKAALGSCLDGKRPPKNATIVLRMRKLSHNSFFSRSPTSSDVERARFAPALFSFLLLL